MSIPLKSQKQLANAESKKRQYQEIWETIKQLPVGQELQIRCHKDAAARIIQAVKKEKTSEVAVRKKVGLMAQGPLKIRKVVDDATQQCNIYLSLEFDGTKL